VNPVSHFGQMDIQMEIYVDFPFIFACPPK